MSNAGSTVHKMFAKKSSKKKQESKKKNVENVGKRLKGKVSAKNAVKRQVVCVKLFSKGL